jgi:hypothetical protein
MSSYSSAASKFMIKESIEISKIELLDCKINEPKQY